MRALVAFLLLSGCATTPTQWVRVDNRPVEPMQLQADETACRGEMQKANLSSTMEPGVSIGPGGIYSPRAKAVNEVYQGCMAQRGYLAQK